MTLDSRLSFSNSLFLQSHPEVAQCFAHALDPHNHLAVLADHHRRFSESGSSCAGEGSTGGGATTFGSAGNATPPLSPMESYTALYPAPPHLTPLPSPSTSPRPMSPHLLDGDHPMPTTNVLGKLTIRVVEARGLGLAAQNQKPYCLLQYDRTESVSREYGAPPPLPKPVSDVKRGGPGIKRGGLVNSRAGAAIASSTTVRRVGPLKSTTPSTSSTAPTLSPPPSSKLRHLEEMTTRIVTDSPPTGDPKDIGTPSSPIWNHQATFDVVAPGRTILLCVYDKLAPQGGFPAHGFLGATVFEPPLSEELGDEEEGLDLWLPLTSALDPTVGGEVRLRIQYETLEARPKLCVDDFQVLRRIGEGSFGQVFRVRKRDTKRIYAMKVISKKNIQSKTALAQVLAERQVLARTLDSPFLIGLKFSFQSPTDLFFVIDYKSGGELFQHLQRDGGRFEEGRVRFYIAEIVLGLAFLHEHNIIYRDLKPENCLLDGSGHVILCDFGLSKLLTDPNGTTRTLCGTTAFTAPEVLLDVGYSYCCDFWSLGVLLFEMCYGWSPFYAETRVDEYDRILNGEIKIPSKKDYSAEVVDLLKKLLTRDPTLRIGYNGSSEIKLHPFFSPIDWTKLSLRQLSPPYKPPTHADEDACDYHDLGQKHGEWMFSGDGRCWSNPSRRGSREEIGARVGGGGAEEGEEGEDGGLFREFAFAAPKEIRIDMEKRRELEELEERRRRNERERQRERRSSCVE